MGRRPGVTGGGEAPYPERSSNNVRCFGRFGGVVGGGSRRCGGKGGVGGCGDRGRDGLGREERILPMVIHLPGESIHNREAVLMEVTHHGVGVPAAKQLDGLFICVCTEESHGATGPKRSGTDTCWRDASRGLEGGGCKSELFGDVVSSDAVDLVVGIVGR